MEITQKAMRHIANQKEVVGVYDYVITDSPKPKSIGFVMRRIVVAAAAANEDTGLCVLPSKFNSKDSGHDKDQNGKSPLDLDADGGAPTKTTKATRNIQDVGNNQLAGTLLTDPDASFMLRQVIEGHFTFQHLRLVQTRSGGPDDSARDEGILEIVWMTGPTVQQASGDRRYAGIHGGNIFLVVHLHFRHFAVDPISNEWIPGVFAVSVFHGHTIDYAPRRDNGTPLYRVNGRDHTGFNQCAHMLTCPVLLRM